MTTLTIRRGSTFRKPYRFGARPLIYKIITGMPSAAPVRFTVAGHGLVDGWPVAVTCLKGPTALNAVNSPPSGDDWHAVTVVDEDTIELNALNAGCMPAYVSGGVLQYYTPVSLAGATARWQIRADVEDASPALAGTNSDGGVVLDDAAKLIEIVITDEQSAALLVASEGRGVFDFEVEIDGEVTCLDSGAVRCIAEVTR